MSESTDNRVERHWLAACVMSAVAFVALNEPLRQFAAEVARLWRKL